MTQAIRINIGCGRTPTPGWHNLDNSASVRLAGYPMLSSLLSKLGFIEKNNDDFIEFCRKHTVRYATATERLPYEDSSVSAIYSSHMLEHLDRLEADAFLKEAKRILQPGGVLRLVVPDIKILVDKYVAEGDADAFIASTYMCFPRARTLPQRIKLFMTGIRHHNWMYDGNSLTRLVTKHGFAGAKVLQPGETTMPDPGELDLRERWTESVYVECRKA